MAHLIRRARVLLAGAITAYASTAMFSSPVAAQISVVGQPGVNSQEITPTQSDPFSTTFNGGVLTLTGAGSISVSPGSQEYNNFVDAVVRITVGDHPVQITPTFDASFRFVNGGGSATDPQTSVDYEANIFEPGFIQIVRYHNSQSLAGNGYTDVSESNDSTTPASFILAPGADYDVSVEYVVSYDATQLMTSDPTSVITLESGGGDFFGSGLTFSLNAVQLPEPAALSFVGASLLLLGRRRAC